MHILIAPDSFKESLSAPQVAQALQTGFSQALLDASFDLLPVGDGGEGTMAALTADLGWAMNFSMRIIIDCAPLAHLWERSLEYQLSRFLLS